MRPLAHRRSLWLSLFALTGLTLAPAHAQQADPAVGEAVGDPQQLDVPAAGFPLVAIDREKREIRVECEALNVDMPLEFFCVTVGGPDHETVLRTQARPAHIHAALLAVGLESGAPVRWNDAASEWIPPQGPPVRIEVEFQQDGRTVRWPASRLVRDIDTKQPMPNQPFIFVGSRILEDGRYAADLAGYVVSLVNFELTVLDVPNLASDANESLELEINPDTIPPAGTPVTMILSPVGADAPTTPITQPAAEEELQGPKVALVTIDAHGEVELDHRPIEPNELAARIEPAPRPIRLSVERGTPLEAIGQTLGVLARAGQSMTTFEAPPLETRESAGAQVPAGEPINIEVGDGGRVITMNGQAYLLPRFIEHVQELAREEANLMRPMSIQPAASAADVKPIDLAAPHAAMYALGFRFVKGVESAGAEGPMTAEEKLAQLRSQWERRVLPQSEAMERAAQTHFEVMQAYQEEINRLLDEADRLRREMDDLDRRYSDLTTPRPSTRPTE